MYRFLISLLCVSSALFSAEIENRALPAKPDARSLSQSDGRTPTLSFSGDPIVWKVKEGGRETLYKIFSQEPSLNETALGWGVGFRLGALLDLSVLNRKIFASFTRFELMKSNHSSSPPERLMIQVNDSLEPSGGSSNFSYGNIDVGLKKGLIATQLFSIETILGAKGGWVDQSHKENYRFSHGERRLFVETKEKLQGVGPLIGFDTHWYLYRGLQLSSHLAGSVQYGDIETKYKESVGGVAVAPSSASSLLFPTASGQLGLGWMGPWRGCLLELGASYEAEYFFRSRKAVQLKTEPQDRFRVRENDQDLVLYGVTVHLSVGF